MKRLIATGFLAVFAVSSFAAVPHKGFPSNPSFASNTGSQHQAPHKGFPYGAPHKGFPLAA